MASLLDGTQKFSTSCSRTSTRSVPTVYGENNLLNLQRRKTPPRLLKCPPPRRRRMRVLYGFGDRWVPPLYAPSRLTFKPLLLIPQHSMLPMRCAISAAAIFSPSRMHCTTRHHCIVLDRCSLLPSFPEAACSCIFFSNFPFRIGGNLVERSKSQDLSPFPSHYLTSICRTGRRLPTLSDACI